MHNFEAYRKEQLLTKTILELFSLQEASWKKQGFDQPEFQQEAILNIKPTDFNTNAPNQLWNTFLRRSR
jgi:hypothetical protein